MKQTASGALDLLQDYYDRFDVPLDYGYYYLKANILVEKYHAFGRPADTDSSCKLEAEKAIDVCRQYAEDEDDSILYLEQKLKKAEISVSYWRKMDLLWDKIDTLRNPDQVVTTSKVDDVLRAFELVKKFWNEESSDEDGIYNIEFFYIFKARVYNALFFYLSKNEQEFEALSDEQLYGFFADAVDCAKKALAYSEMEDKSEEEHLNERIPEQIEELKQLRRENESSVPSFSMSVNSSEQEFLEELRACLDDDGKISSKERRLLDRLRKALGISKKRAKAMEDELLKK